MRREDLWVTRWRDDGTHHFEQATDADLASLGLVALDGIDVEELRDDRNALVYAIEFDVKSDIQSPAFRRFVALADQVLAAIDGEDTDGT